MRKPTEETCDLCEPALHEPCEGYTAVLIKDPSDILDAPPHEWEAPEREAVVCYEHFEVIKQLPTVRSASH